MRIHLTPLRAALALLLVASAILFLVGSTIERNHRHHEQTPAAQTAHSESGEGTKTGEPEHSKSESGGGKSSGTETGHVGAGHAEAGAKILGVNTESLALSIVAVVLSVLLAAAIWLRRWSRLVLLAVVGFGLVFAAGDAREVVHQLDDSNNGLAAVAAILITLHLAVAALAALLLRPRPLAGVPASEPI
jgi:hypothetical protein